jgi:peroxiredoxin
VTTTLNDLLDTYWRHAAERAPAFAAALESEARRIAESGGLARAPRAGERAPDAVLHDAPDGCRRLSDLWVDRPLVLIFYRDRGCAFCTLELRAWQRALPALHAAGGRLVAISPQDERAIALMRERDRLEFSMVADTGNAIARRWGVLHEVAPTLRDAYAAAGVPVGGPDGRNATLPLPAVFVVGIGGRVDWSHVDPSWRRRAEPADVVRRVAALGGQGASSTPRC